MKALVEAGKELAALDTQLSNGVKIPKLTVLTWNEKRTVEKDNMTIQFRPLWEWLLEKTEV